MPELCRCLVALTRRLDIRKDSKVNFGIQFVLDLHCFVVVRQIFHLIVICAFVLCACFVCFVIMCFFL